MALEVIAGGFEGQHFPLEHPWRATPVFSSVEFVSRLRSFPVGRFDPVCLGGSGALVPLPLI